MRKVLFLTTIEFRLPFNGGTVYSHCLYQALQAVAQVEVCVLRGVRRFEADKLHKLACLLRGLVSPVPLNVLYHSGFSSQAPPSATAYDLVVVDHIESYETVRATGVPCVLIAHNLEYRLAADKIQSGAISRLFSLRKRLEAYERQAFSEVAGVICISATELDIVRELNPRCVQLLPAFSGRPVASSHSDVLRLGFLGPAHWMSNWRTVDMLVKEVLPHLSRPFEFVLAGSGWAESGITFPPETRQLGFVEHTDDFWQAIDLLVAPTQQGAGVNIKICEAMYAGRNVVTNTSSTEAIFGSKPLPDTLVAVDTNADLRSFLETFSIPETIPSQQLFTQDVLVERMRAFLESLDV